MAETTITQKTTITQQPNEKTAAVNYGWPTSTGQLTAGEEVTFTPVANGKVSIDLPLPTGWTQQENPKFTVTAGDFTITATKGSSDTESNSTSLSISSGGTLPPRRL